MDRKKTILIAVLINAGLLVLLFIAALHNEEEAPKSVDLSQMLPQESRPLFNDAVELGVQVPVAQPVVEPVRIETPVVAQAPQIVHQLPSVTAQPEAPVLIAAAPPIAAPVTQGVEVTVKKGDSLEKIAKLHKTTVDEILRHNQLQTHFLRIGQVLKIPPERAMQQVAKAKAPVVEKRVGDVQPEYYTVKVGDNPWTIAMKHHMKVDELLKINSLNEERARRLKPGDRLRIR